METNTSSPEKNTVGDDHIFSFSQGGMVGYVSSLEGNIHTYVYIYAYIYIYKYNIHSTYTTIN